MPEKDRGQAEERESGEKEEQERGTRVKLLTHTERQEEQLTMMVILGSPQDLQQPLRGPW